MRPLIATLLLLSFALTVTAGCEKNVQEVRRKDALTPEAPAAEPKTASVRVAPEAPGGAPRECAGRRLRRGRDTLSSRDQITAGRAAAFAKPRAAGEDHAVLSARSRA